MGPVGPPLLAWHKRTAKGGSLSGAWLHPQMGRRFTKQAGQLCHFTPTCCNMQNSFVNYHKLYCCHWEAKPARRGRGKKGGRGGRAGNVLEGDLDETGPSGMQAGSSSGIRFHHVMHELSSSMLAKFSRGSHLYHILQPHRSPTSPSCRMSLLLLTIHLKQQ